MKILIAGASGYIGRALMAELLSRYPDAQITALSRAEQRADDPRVNWVACDLFSLKSLERAVPRDVTHAFYLVHSMGPTAQMDQGSFADYDLILADNFARVLKRSPVTHVAYLGGLIPERKVLSTHLQSRLEVEEVFREAKLPLTVFRAGLIVGPRGSSFRILTNLVNRLPVMICPRWTQTLTTPVDLDRVVHALASAITQTETVGQVYDLAGCRALTYVQMMRDTAAKLGRRRYFLTVPVFTPTLSRLWVRLITGAPKELVYPLVESLEHAMVARPDHLFEAHEATRTYRELLDTLELRPPASERASERARTPRPFSVPRKTVRSVQRLPLPAGRDAAWVLQRYAEWLPKFLAPFVKVTNDGPLVRFAALTSNIVVLELARDPDRSSADRQLLYIRGGLLSARDNRGRLEFRVVLGRRFVLAAIHDFTPALPWSIYRLTQAVAHAWVMGSFRRYLRQIKT